MTLMNAAIMSSPIMTTDDITIRTDSFDALMDSSDLESRFVIEMFALALIPPFSGMGIEPISWSPVGFVTSEADLTFPQSTSFVYSDGDYITKPTDRVRPNMRADPRAIQAYQVDRTLPLNPDSSRRAQTQLGRITLANADGGIDSMVSGFAIDGQRVRIFLGADDAPFEEYRLLVETLGLGFDSDSKQVTIQVENTSSLLDAPLQTNVYDGQTLSGGDQGLIDRLRPLAFGQVFNATPVLQVLAQLIYQIHDGPIQAITAVRDKGAPLTFDSNVADFNALVSAVVPAGSYVTCLATGHFKLGTTAAGVITCDLQGDNAISYESQTGAILLKIAQQRLNISPQFIFIPSFLSVLGGIAGYYADGASSITGQTVFDAMLRPLAAWYGQGTDVRLNIDIINVPDVQAAKFVWDDTDVLSLRRLRNPVRPRHAQQFGYKKNWTVQSTDSLAGSLTTAEIDSYSLPYSKVKEERGQINVVHNRSVDGGLMETYFATEADAAAQLTTFLDLFKDRELFRCQVSRAGFAARFRDIVQITDERYGLSAGKKFSIVGIKGESKNDRVELRLLG